MIENEYYEVENFDYNGFFGETLPGKAPYTAKFEKWTSDPGVAKFLCSDGKTRFIPTFAIICDVEPSWPIQEDKSVLFGTACSSK